MRLCLMAVVQAHCSLRSTVLLIGALQAHVPCIETVRGWLWRLGLFLLQSAPRRNDWIWIIDHTMQLGTARCLVILGVSRAQVQEHGFRLGHPDVCVLALEVVEHSDGEVVHQQLVATAQRVGVPLQIVSDHGSDLAKGIRLFQQQQPQVIDSYDVTHKMACLLKGILQEDARWQAFVSRCALAASQVRQTAGSFLMPPSLRAKARYMNLDTLLAWAERMQRLSPQDVRTRVATALGLPPEQAWSWWTEKFSWLEEFRVDLQTWHQLLDLTHRAEEQVRAQGLRRESATDYGASLPAELGNEVRVHRLAQQITEYFEEEGAKVPPNQALLGSSEVVESLFGSYKRYVERGIGLQVGVNVLMLPVLASQLTMELLARALSAVPLRAVWSWCATHLGASRQKRFAQVFGKPSATAAAEKGAVPIPGVSSADEGVAKPEATGPPVQQAVEQNRAPPGQGLGSVAA